MARCSPAAGLGCLGRFLLLVTLLLTGPAVVESFVGEVDETAMPDKQLGMAVQVCACTCACVRVRVRAGTVSAIVIAPTRPKAQHQFRSRTVAQYSN